MDSRGQRAAGISRRLIGIAALAASIWGIVRVYRWAEPNPNALQAIGTSANTPDLAMRMDKTAYASYFGGAKNWALWAERIDLMRLPGTIGLTNLQRADLTNIRDGKLFDVPADQRSP